MEKKSFFPLLLGLLTIFILSSIQLNLYSQEKIQTVKNDKKKEFLPRQNEAKPADNNESSFEDSAITMLIKSLFILAIFIGIAFFVFKWIEKRRHTLLTDENAVIKVLKTTTVSPNKSLQLVEIGKKVYILGLSDQNISLINIIEDPIEIDSVRELCKEDITEQGQNKSFKDILLSNFNFTPNSLNKSKGGTINSSVNFFNEQKEKLKELKKKF